MNLEASYGVDDTPRPIGVDPAVTGSFRRLDPTQGAVISTRETASEAAEAAREMRPATSRRVPGASKIGRPSKAHPAVIAAIAVGAVIVAVLVVTLALAVIGPKDEGAAETDEQATTLFSSQSSVSPDQTVDYGGYTYSIIDNDKGGRSFARVSGGESVPIFDVPGTPVSIALEGGVFYIAENLSDGTWDVLCYLAADGTQMTRLLGDDGQPLVGKGTLQSSEVQDGKLVLVDDAGTKTTIPLS